MSPYTRIPSPPDQLTPLAMWDLIPATAGEGQGIGSTRDLSAPGRQSTHVPQIACAQPATQQLWSLVSATHTRAQSRGSPPSLAEPVGDGNSGTACFPLASSAPLPTWALWSITLHRFQGALSSLSKVTPRSHCKAPRACAVEQDPCEPQSPFPTSLHANRRSDTGTPRPVAWVGVRGWLLMSCVELPKPKFRGLTCISQSHPCPPSPPSGQGPSAPTGNHHAVRVARETGRCCSHQPSGTEPFSQPPAMTCPGLTQVAKRGGGGGVADTCHFPATPSPPAVRQKELFPASPLPDVSLTPSPSITPGASLPLGAVSPPLHARCRREGGLTGQTRPPGTAGSGRGWSVHSPGPWLRMLRQPCQAGGGGSAAPGSRCWLGAEPPAALGEGVSSSLLSPSPMQRAEACGRGGRRVGVGGVRGEPLIDGAAAAPRGWAGAELLAAEGPKGSAPAARRGPRPASPAAPRRAEGPPPLSSEAHAGPARTPPPPALPAATADPPASSTRRAAGPAGTARPFCPGGIGQHGAMLGSAGSAGESLPQGY